jgi:cytochrome c oxidase subunit 3
MNLLQALTEKPWVPAGAPEVAAGRSFSLSAPTLALRFFLVVIGVLFGLLIIAYAERMAGEEWRPTPQPWLLWLNTICLVLSSVAMQWARIAARRDREAETSLALIAAGVFALAFLTGQLAAWRQLDMLPVFDISNAAIAFFYMITGLHALHLMGGLVAWGRTTARVWRSAELEAARTSIELCATYWHFLLFVWLVLFGLLFSGDENLELLLTICGFR